MFPITVNVDLKSLYNDCPRLVTFLLEDPDLGRSLFKGILRDKIDSLTYDEPGDFNYELLVNVRFTNALPGGGSGHLQVLVLQIYYYYRLGTPCPPAAWAAL